MRKSANDYLTHTTFLIVLTNWTGQCNIYIVTEIVKVWICRKNVFSIIF